MLPEASAQIQSNFNLKNLAIDLVRAPRTAERANLTIVELEALRTDGRAVSASKYGLEAICGASCETGAQ